jgi:biopolymer transport protein TolQ
MEMLLQASLPVQGVMIILFFFSFMSWTYILGLWSEYGRLQGELQRFSRQFLSAKDLTTFYRELNRRRRRQYGMSLIFLTGYQEIQLRTEEKFLTPERALQNAEKAMNAALLREEQSLTANLGFLATVGSISPYIGLFGTVWGVMLAFHSIGDNLQASLAVVAPGISEALLATAMGLFAAIPAVMAYNHFLRRAQGILSQYEAFLEECLVLFGQEVFSGETA